MSFAEVLETLIGILHRRIAEQGRKAVAADVKDARREFSEGRCKAASPEELMKEIQH